jgi:hypothetical protein
MQKLKEMSAEHAARKEEERKRREDMQRVSRVMFTTWCMVVLRPLFTVVLGSNPTLYNASPGVASTATGASPTAA